MTHSSLGTAEIRVKFMVSSFGDVLFCRYNPEYCYMFIIPPLIQLYFGLLVCCLVCLFLYIHVVNLLSFLDREKLTYEITCCCVCVCVCPLFQLVEPLDQLSENLLWMLWHWRLFQLFTSYFPTIDNNNMAGSETCWVGVMPVPYNIGSGNYMW